MQNKERPSLETSEPRRAWNKPVLREEDYSLTANAPIGNGVDLGFYS